MYSMGIIGYNFLEGLLWKSHSIIPRVHLIDYCYSAYLAGSPDGTAMQDLVLWEVGGASTTGMFSW